jgi:hypothetical protein
MTAGIQSKQCAINPCLLSLSSEIGRVARSKIRMTFNLLRTARMGSDSGCAGQSGSCDPFCANFWTFPRIYFGRRASLRRPDSGKNQSNATHERAARRTPILSDRKYWKLDKSLSYSHLGWYPSISTHRSLFPLRFPPRFARGFPRSWSTSLGVSNMAG